MNNRGICVPVCTSSCIKGVGGAVYINILSKRHEMVHLVRFGMVACRVVTASFSKWPSEPISKVGEKPLVSLCLFSFTCSSEAVPCIY